MTTSQIRSLVGRKIFSGIQPTGIPHLGNYFGAIEQWISLTNKHYVEHPIGGQKPIFCIVDIHAYSSSQTKFGPKFYENIVASVASLLALGLDTSKCILFRQSDVLEHNYLASVFQNIVSMERLSSMIQFKEKIAARSGRAASESIPTGLLTYPVLQAADILLYGADLVPVGEDQAQHIELTRHLANKFNRIANKRFFPLPTGLLGDVDHSRRIKSLRNPERKMSKSDVDWRATLGVMDEADVIEAKCKKALTDSDSRVLYEPDKRPGVANLMRLLHLTSSMSLEQMELHFEGKQTSDLKRELAHQIIERFKPARAEFKRLVSDRVFLESQLECGANEARAIASETVRRVRHELGSRLLSSCVI